MFEYAAPFLRVAFALLKNKYVTRIENIQISGARNDGKTDRLGHFCFFRLVGCLLLNRLLDVTEKNEESKKMCSVVYMKRSVSSYTESRPAAGAAGVTGCWSL